MKKLFAAIVVLIVAVPMFGDASERSSRTIIVRDGKVVFDDSNPGGKRGFIGVSTAEMSEDLREYFGASRDSGVLVSSLSDNGPAAKAGLRVGDVIVSINGKSVDSPWDVAANVRDKKAGDAVRLEVIRGKSKQTIVISADEREMPEMSHAFDLGRLDREIVLPRINASEWRASIATPELEQLRERIHELEQRLRELQKKIDNK